MLAGQAEDGHEIDVERGIGQAEHADPAEHQDRREQQVIRHRDHLHPQPTENHSTVAPD